MINFSTIGVLCTSTTSCAGLARILVLISAPLLVFEKGAGSSILGMKACTGLRAADLVVACGSCSKNLTV